jgi:hypothetical protein
MNKRDDAVEIIIDDVSEPGKVHEEKRFVSSSSAAIYVTRLVQRRVVIFDDRALYNSYVIKRFECTCRGWTIKKVGKARTCKHVTELIGERRTIDIREYICLADAVSIAADQWVRRRWGDQRRADLRSVAQIVRDAENKTASEALRVARRKKYTSRDVLRAKARAGEVSQRALLREVLRPLSSTTSQEASERAQVERRSPLPPVEPGPSRRRISFIDE